MIGLGNSTTVGIGGIKNIIQFSQRSMELFSFRVIKNGKQVSHSSHSCIRDISAYPYMKEKQLERAAVLTETLI